MRKQAPKLLLESLDQKNNSFEILKRNLVSPSSFHSSLSGHSPQKLNFTPENIRNYSSSQQVYETSHFLSPHVNPMLLEDEGGNDETTEFNVVDQHTAQNKSYAQDSPNRLQQLRKSYRALEDQQQRQQQATTESENIKAEMKQEIKRL